MDQLYEIKRCVADIDPEALAFDQELAVVHKEVLVGLIKDIAQVVQAINGIQASRGHELVRQFDYQRTCQRVIESARELPSVVVTEIRRGG